MPLPGRTLPAGVASVKSVAGVNDRRIISFHPPGRRVKPNGFVDERPTVEHATLRRRLQSSSSYSDLEEPQRLSHWTALAGDRKTDINHWPAGVGTRPSDKVILEEQQSSAAVGTLVRGITSRPRDTLPIHPPLESLKSAGNSTEASRYRPIQKSLMVFSRPV